MEETREEKRSRLTQEHGKVWNTQELEEDFKVMGFVYCRCIAERKIDHVKCVLDFSDSPRFYWITREG